ncbi:MAG: hypothetical protein Q7T55_08120 [Solirubrobacteraceae bacterium]|nr:hypothetical protein [Solirubrobacteraceae bacterium]
MHSRPSLRRLAPAITLTAALLAPAPVVAARHVVYDVELEGSYRYAISTDHREKGYRRQSDAQVSGTFRSTAAQFSFVDGAVDERPGGGPLTDLRVDYTSTGSLSEKTTSEFGGNSTRSCSISEEPVSANGWVRDSLTQYFTPGMPTVMEVRIGQAVHAPFVASGDCPEGTGIGFGTQRDSLGTGRMDAQFELPVEAVGPGKTIQLVKGPKWEGCPGADGPEVTACSFSWQGTVTFTKAVDEELGADGQPVPSPTPVVVPPGPFIGAKPAPAPVPVPVPGPPSDATTSPSIPSERVTVDRAAATVFFGALCPSGCTGTATVSAGGGRPVTGKLTFSVKPSATAKTVKLTVPKRVRAALRREGRGRVALSLKARSGGGALKTTLPLKVGR